MDTAQRHLFDLPVELLENILFYIPPVLLVTRVCATCILACSRSIAGEQTVY